MADFAADAPPTEEELKLLAEDNTLPPAEESDATDTPPAAEPEPAAPALAAEAAPTADQAPDAAAAKAFAEFVERHKDKPPEDLLRLAFQQDAARRERTGDVKRYRDEIAALRQGMTASVTDVARRQAEERAKFDQALKDDPDLATRMAYDRMQASERGQAENAAQQAFVARQTELARQMIPEFDTVAPRMVKFGIERLGFDEGEVRGIQDARELATLHMAMSYADLIDRGVVDRSGKLLITPAAPATAPATDPRLASPAPPRTLSNAGGTAGSTGQSLKDRGDALIAAMEAGKDYDPDEADRVLAGLAAGGR